MIKKPDPVVHFEMPYSNPKRVAGFYKKAFGWDMQFLPKMGNYVLATTSPVSKNNMHVKKGAINGGFYPKQKKGDNTVHFVISVDNLEKHISVIKKAGGKVLGKPMDVPGVGKFIMVKDTEGNKVGMLQSVRM